MTASDLYAGSSERACGEVQHGRGDHADVDHVDTGSGQATDQCCSQRWPAEPAVAANGDRGFAFFEGAGAERPAQGLSHFLVDGGRHNAADVIGLEYGCTGLH